jgi:hypothetical protein
VVSFRSLRAITIFSSFILRLWLSTAAPIACAGIMLSEFAGHDSELSDAPIPVNSKTVYSAGSVLQKPLKRLAGDHISQTPR